MVARLVYVFTNDELKTEYHTDGDLTICYGWDGTALSPLSRTAYIRKFGAVFVELAEMAAGVKIEEMRKVYENTHFAAHVREARKHQADGCKAPKAGAFVFGIGSGLKCDGGRGIFELFEAFAQDSEYIEKEESAPRVCFVAKVIEVSAEDFARPELADELIKMARERGEEWPNGCATDDPEPEYNENEPETKYKYYYTIGVAVVCKKSGRWFLIDSEGYNYARYNYAPTSWRTMFENEIKEAQRQEEERQEMERQEEERKAAEALAEYRAKCAKYEGAGLEDLTKYREALTAANAAERAEANANGWRSPERKAAQKKVQAAAAALMAAEKRNIKAMAAYIFPGIRCKVTKADNWKDSGYVLTFEDGPTLEEFKNNTDFDLFSAYWTEYRMDDCTERHRYDLTEFADKFGDGRGVDIKREMSQAERERMTSAILEAVPAAANICWDNRHNWTQEEIKQAAAACGVDGFDLWRTYDHKHSYFNYIDIKTLATWAHELISYELKPKGAKKANTAATATAAPTEAAADNMEAISEDTERKPQPQADGLKMEKYSEKATVIRGYNEQQRAQLLEMGGRENYRLSGGKGIIFSTRKHGDKLREWMQAQQAENVNEQPAADPEPKQPQEPAPEITALFETVCSLLATLAEVANETKKYEGVTIPAATLARWKTEAETGTRNVNEAFAEVCACLASLTPENRDKFDALGVIFWTLADELRQGFNAGTISTATDYARVQLFDLIDATQTPQQAAAVRQAFEALQKAA